MKETQLAFIIQASKSLLIRSFAKKEMKNTQWPNRKTKYFENRRNILRQNAKREDNSVL